MTTIQEERLRLKEELKDVMPPIFSRRFSRAALKKVERWEEIARGYAEQIHIREAEISALRLILTHPHPPELLDDAGRALSAFEAQLEHWRSNEKLALKQAQSERENVKQAQMREDVEIANFHALPAGEQIAMIRRAEEEFLEVRRRERRNERAAELRAERKTTGTQPKPKSKPKKRKPQ